MFRHLTHWQVRDRSGASVLIGWLTDRSGGPNQSGDSRLHASDAHSRCMVPRKCRMQLHATLLNVLRGRPGVETLTSEASDISEVMVSPCCAHAQMGPTRGAWAPRPGQHPSERACGATYVARAATPAPERRRARLRLTARSPSPPGAGRPPS